MHDQNKKHEDFVSVSRLNGECFEGLIIWESKCHKKFLGGMWSIKLIDQLILTIERAGVYLSDIFVWRMRSAIMQDFWDNEKKTMKNGRLAAFFAFISANFVMGYICLRPYILFHIHGPAISLSLELRKYHKITQIHNSR